MSVEGNTLTVNLSLSDLLTQIIENHDNELNGINCSVSYYCLKTSICVSLKAPIPFSESAKFISLNSKILLGYLKIAIHKYNGTTVNEEDFEFIKEAIANLHDKIKDLDDYALMKLKICFNAFNDQFLSSKDELFINNPWNIILFSYNPNRFQSLRYDRIEYLISKLDEENDNIPDLNSLYGLNPSFPELTTFLTYFLIFLKKYLLENAQTPAKEALMIKEALLISIPELHNIENYYLETHSLDTLNLPPIIEGTFTEYTFEELKPKVINCTINLNIADSKVTSYPHLYATLITCALFIKTFLTLSINMNSKNDIIDLLTNSLFYKKPNYKIATSIVDEIIFNNAPNLTK